MQDPVILLCQEWLCDISIGLNLLIIFTFFAMIISVAVAAAEASETQNARCWARLKVLLPFIAGLLIARSAYPSSTFFRSVFSGVRYSNSLASISLNASATAEIASATAEIASGTQEIASAPAEIASGTQEIASAPAEIASATAEIASASLNASAPAELQENVLGTAVLIEKVE